MVLSGRTSSLRPSALFSYRPGPRWKCLRLPMLTCILLSRRITFCEGRNRSGKKRDALPPRMARLSKSFDSELRKMRCLEFLARSRRSYGKSVPNTSGTEQRQTGFNARRKMYLDFNGTDSPFLIL